MQTLTELSPKEALKQFFGFNNFKGLQEGVVNSVLEGNDTFVIMPTGGIGDGKGAGGADSGDKLPLPPSAACIFEVNNKAGAKGNSDCEKNKNCNVIVGAADDGFFPDICLNSSYLGEVQNRTIFKPGMMPESSGKAVESIEQKNKTKEVNRNCERGDLGTCELESWDNAIVYCPNDDLRDAEYYGHP